MKISLTRGIARDQVERCLGRALTPTKAWKIIDAFKDEHKKEYKIEPYNRLLKVDSRRIAIDFGDYSYFFLVEADLTEKDLAALELMWNHGGVVAEPKKTK